MAVPPRDSDTAKTPATAMPAWVYAVLAVLFTAMGLIDLFGPEPDPRTASWEHAFGVGNGLVYWMSRGAPPWVRPATLVVFIAGLFAVARDWFF